MTESGFEEVALRDGERQLGSVVGEWRDLAASVEGTSYFQTPDWVLSWWENRGRPPTLVGLWRDASGRLEAVAFLSRLRESLRRGVPLTIPVVTNSGSGDPYSADRSGWPVLAHRVVDVRHWITKHHWRGSLLLRHLDQRTGPRCVPRGARLVLTTRCPVLELPSDGPMLPRSKNLAKQLRRFDRQLDQMGVEYTWTPPEQMTPDAVDLLFALHASARSGRGASSFTPEVHADFQRSLVAASSPGCGPAMVIATCRDRPIGIDYGFVWRDTFHSYQSGWDASYAKLRLGTVLTGETIRLAGINGLRAIDFLRGIEGYKYQFGASDVVDETWLLPRGPSGRLLGWKYRLARAQQARDYAEAFADRGDAL